MSYAEKTSVSIDRSQAEIKKILSRYGADGFVYGELSELSVVMFEIKSRRIKIILPMPKKPSASATQASGKTYDQVCRSRWRAIALVIKAKLESVEVGITTLEQEFMAHIMLPNGQTVGEAILPQIDQAYCDGKMPPLLGFDGRR